MTGISTFIVSKNRPLFIRDYLKSLRGMELDITVFYLATEPKYEESYLKLSESMKNVKFVKEEGLMSDFMLEWIKDASGYVFISVDDNICKHPFDVESIINFMDKNKDVFAFSLRLDPTIKAATDLGGGIGEYEEHGDIIIYYPATGTEIWDQEHAFESFGIIHRKVSIEKLLGMIKFNIVNQLEIEGRKIFNVVGKMACFKYAPITNIFVDSGFGKNLVEVTNRCTDEEAYDFYVDNREIDIKRTFKERDSTAKTHIKNLYLKPKGRRNGKAGRVDK